MIDPTRIKSCDLLELPVIGDKIKEKDQNTIIFYFENSSVFVVDYEKRIKGYSSTHLWRSWK